jgi:predicted nucleic acid-binding Zn ribbon protein
MIKEQLKMNPIERPEKIGSILKELLQNLGIDKRIEEYDALLAWDGIVGEKIASLTRVKHVRDGILFVEVKGAVWMSEIQMMKNEIIDKLNEGRDRGKIRELVLLQWRGRNGKEEDQ